MKPPINLAILASGSGTTLANLIEEISAGRLAARIEILIASRPEIGAIEKARRAGIPTMVIERKNFPDVESFSAAVFARCAAADLVCLAGWLQLLRLPAEFHGRVMNIHPALLPRFGGRGMYGHHVHDAVLAARSSASGCTVHFVDNQYDHGPIILQRSCPVRSGDTPATLAARVFEEEKIAYPEAIRLFQQGRIILEDHQARILPPAAVKIP